MKETKQISGEEVVELMLSKQIKDFEKAIFQQSIKDSLKREKGLELLKKMKKYRDTFRLKRIVSKVFGTDIQKKNKEDLLSKINLN